MVIAKTRCLLQLRLIAPEHVQVLHNKIVAAWSSQRPIAEAAGPS
jgi:hypothetical protein